VDAYRPFAVRVARVERLSSTFRRVTLAGECLAGFAPHGFDQRINLLFLDDHHDHEAVVAAPDWMAAWRCGPPEEWAPLRTYTVRAFRPEAWEVDVDFALHGDGGPASRWATAARPGDRVVMIGATPGHQISDVAWTPPPAARQLLLAADETALPAAAAIAEQRTGPGLTLVLEVPERDDRLPMPGHAEVIWRVRSRGERMEPVVRDLLDAGFARDSDAPVLEEPDDEVWEVPAPRAGSPCYAWLAGEAGAVVSLRRLLVGERGMDRRSIAFMGYWRRAAGGGLLEKGQAA
jgi:NADPH-dependent ferric siderophore reductase